MISGSERIGSLSEVENPASDGLPGPRARSYVASTGIPIMGQITHRRWCKARNLKRIPPSPR
jgi:hypothetical protein